MSKKPTYEELEQQIRELEQAVSDSRQAEAVLQESEEKFRLAFENANDGVCLVDTDGNLVRVNNRMCDIFGYSKKELESMTVNDIAHPEDKDISPKFIKKSVSGEVKSTVFEKRYFHKQGQIILGQVSSSIIKDAKGDPLYFISHVQDITQMKQTEEALRESESNLKKAQALTQLGSWQFDLKTQEVLWSDEIYRIFGLDKKEGPPNWPEGHEKLFHPDDWEWASIAIKEAINRGAGYEFDDRFFRPDGSVGWLHVKGEMVCSEDGSTKRLIGVVQDITERKQLEDAFHEGEEKYRTMMEAMKEPVYICSQDFMVEYMNPAMIDRIGRDGTGELCYKTLHGLENKCSWCAHDRIIRGEKFDQEIVSPLDNRNYKVCHSPLFHKDGFVSKMTIYRDVTEQRKLEKHLLQAQKMEAIGTLAGGIAHDFNNILSAVIGYTELAQTKLESDSEIKNDLKEVLTAGVRAKDLVKQILAFSRQTQKEQMPVQMDLVAKEALKLLRSSLPTTIDIQQNIQSQSVILSDPTQLHQIVMNLCTNAAHAMREDGGTLEITLTDVELDSDFASTHLEIRPGEYLKLTVSDTGHGMTPEVMSRIFDPFFTTKPKDEGTGLGLSVVHGIVKDCGGTITVYSEPDKGTTFNLYFPVIEGKAEEKPGEYKIIPTGTEHILVVDDEKTIIDIIKKILTSLGYAVEIRTSSLEALELFKAMPDKFDLVITDMTMPQMTGDKLALELIKIRPDIPVILCTGFSEKITKEKAQTMGIKAFLLKPLLKEEMAHTIRRVLDEVNSSDQE